MSVPFSFCCRSTKEQNGNAERLDNEQFTKNAENGVKSNNNGHADPATSDTPQKGSEVLNKHCSVTEQ